MGIIGLLICCYGGCEFGYYLKVSISEIANLLLLVIGVAITFLIVRDSNSDELFKGIDSLSINILIFSLVFTIIGYMSLIGYDWLALKYIGKKLPANIVIFTSFISYSLSNTMGATLFSGGAVRYYFYKRFGLTLGDVSIITIFCMVGFGFGETIVTWLAIAIYPEFIVNYISEYVFLSNTFVRAVSIFILSSILCLIIYYIKAGGLFYFRALTFQLPSTKLLFSQLILAMMDMIFSGAALFVLLPNSHLTLPAFLVIYTVALVVSVFSHVPGGIGVFESVIMFFLTEYMTEELIVVALMVYRFIYYIIPFLIGLLFFGLSRFISEFQK